MDSCPTEDRVLADGCDSLRPSTPSSSNANGAQSSMTLPTASTPVTVQPSPQLGQCVYVLSPWRRSRTVYTAGQSPSQNTHNASLLRFTHPTPAPVGLLRLAPYRPYYPSVASRTPGAGVPRDFTQDYRYAHEYYNAYTGTADFGAFTGGQEVQQPEESTAQANYESMFSSAYPPQTAIYPAYRQRQCWGPAAISSLSYGSAESPDKSRTIAYYPDRVAKLGTPAEYVSEDGSNGSGVGNMTKKSVRVKFMGPETMYLTTKTLEMQPGRSSVDVTESPGMSVLDVPSESSLQVFENLRGTDCAAEGIDLNEVVVQTSTDDDATQEQDDDQERVTFSSIEEALASIDPTTLASDEVTPQPGPALPDKTFLQVSAVAYQGFRMTDDKQEEVIKAAKSLFSKRTRTLYHWLYPETSKNKLKATVSAAWDTLTDVEKQFYVSQVLGRFGLQASSLMINPQLDGIKGLPTEVMSSSSSSAVRPRLIPLPPQEPVKLASAVEAQQAVDQLFASCADSESWTSYCGASPSNADPSTNIQSPTLAAAALISPPAVSVPTPQSSRSNKSRAGFYGGSHGQTDSRRKRSFSRMAETGGRARLAAVHDQLEEEVTILKRMRESKLEADFEEDADLTNELEKYRLMAQDSDRNASSRDGDDFWRRTPDPEDLFTHLEF